jgi:hypothetical protein
MGYYIGVPSNHGKAELIRQLHGGEIIAAAPRWEDIPEGKALVVVVDNGIFEAAGYAYDEQEYRAFTSPSDYRPRTYVLLDRDKAETLSGRARS